MSEVSSKSATDVLRPYLILSRIIGVRSIDSTNYIKLILSVIFALFICSYYATVWIISIKRINIYSNAEHKWEFAECLYNTAFVLRFISIVTSIGLGLFQTKLREKLAKSLDEVDITLKCLGSESDFSKISLKCKIEMAIYCLYLAVILVSSYITYLIKSPNDAILFNMMYFTCLYIYAELVDYTICMDFLCFVRCINSEVQRANDVLSDVNALSLSPIPKELVKYEETNNNICKKVFTVTSSQKNSRSLTIKKEVFRIRKLLRVIRQVHLELYKVTKKLSNLYGIQVSMEMAINVFYNTCFLYTAYRYKYPSMRKLFLPNEIASMLLFSLFATFKISIINYTCDKAVQNAEKTNEIIYTFYGENTDDDTRQEMKIFSLQLCLCHTVYSAFGLHPFNCKHICSVTYKHKGSGFWNTFCHKACIGITTTFLVIMIQMIEPPAESEDKLSIK